MHIAVIGPPGAGKGTHAEKIVARFDLLYVSTGELLRRNLENLTSLGLMAQTYRDSGEIVPSEVIDAMIVDFLGKVPPDKSLMFNGFPRTTYQAQFLDSLFSKQARALEAVIYLNVSDDEIVKRLSERLICGTCQTPFHLSYKPPAQADICDVCGGILYRREDDRPDMVRNRLRIFHRAADPLIEYYQASQRLVVVDGEGEIDDIDQTIINTVEAIQQHTLQPATFEQVAQIRALKQVTISPLVGRADDPSLNLVFLGAPGAGKGTQAAYLSQLYDIPRIATGDLFRENFRNETELGKLAKTYIDHGKLVPDDVTEAMVKDRLSYPDVLNGFILDGFPRNLPQAEALTEMLINMNRRLEGVIYLKVSDEEITKRLSGRQLCRQCQSPFHKSYNPFKACPSSQCQGEHLYQRVDDRPETVQDRLRIFHGETEPLVDYYRQAGLLIEVYGKGELAIIKDQIILATEMLKKKHRQKVILPSRVAVSPRIHLK